MVTFSASGITSNRMSEIQLKRLEENQCKDLFMFSPVTHTIYVLNNWFDDKWLRSIHEVRQVDFYYIIPQN